MPSTVAVAEKRHKAVTKDKNRYKNRYKSYIIQLRSTVETADRLKRCMRRLVMQAYTSTDHIQLTGVKRHMPSTVAEGDTKQL